MNSKMKEEHIELVNINICRDFLQSTHTNHHIFSIKRGKSTCKGWLEVIPAIHHLKMSDNVLEEMHIGLSKM
jgi:hypothetical protein